jgi:hypothetical protein
MKILAGVLGAALLAGGGGYAAGVAFQKPEVEIRTVTETVTEEVEVPGPVRWRTKEVPFVPKSCLEAIESGLAMAQLIDDYDALLTGEVDALFVDAYNTVDDAYNAGGGYGGFGAIENTLDQLEGRYDSAAEEVKVLQQTWEDTAWYGPSQSCVSSK